MSLAASAVPTWGSRRADLAPQLSANSLDSLSSAVTSAGVSGLESIPMYASSWEPVMHVTGVDSPTPRGSNPTMSYWARTLSLTTDRAARAYWMPEPPGPPGLMSREPARLPVAGRRITLSSMRSPEGFV